MCVVAGVGERHTLSLLGHGRCGQEGDEPGLGEG